MKKILLSIFCLLIILSRVQTAYAIEGSIDVPGVGIIPIPEGSEIIPNPNGGGNGEGSYEIVFPPGSGLPPMCANEIIPPSGPPENIPPPDQCEITHTCENPPTPTTPPGNVCNSICTSDSQCSSGLICVGENGVSKGDKHCRLPSNPESSTCQPPTVSPTPTETPVPTPTTAPSVTPTPTTIPSVTPTPKPSVTPTPTPFPFSEAMCKCDGIELSSKTFTGGSTLTVTAYAKVEGGDTSYANISKMLFSSGSGVDPNIKRDIPYDVPVAVSIIEQSSTKVRYKATWPYKVPDHLDPKLTYRIWADPQCVRKQAVGFNEQQKVAGAETSTQGNLFTNIFGFVYRMLGGKQTTTQKVQSGNETQVVQGKGNDSLQLDTLSRGEVTGTDSCRYIKYRAK